MAVIASPIQQILLVTARHLSIQPRTPLAMFSSEFKDPIRWRDRPAALGYRQAFAHSRSSITGSSR